MSLQTSPVPSKACKTSSFDSCTGPRANGSLIWQNNKIGTFQNQTKQHTMEEIPNNYLVCSNPVNNGINYLSVHAGFLPSTVSHELQFKTKIWNHQVSSQSAEREGLHIITYYQICTSSLQVQYVKSNSNIIILLSLCCINSTLTNRHASWTSTDSLYD